MASLKLFTDEDVKRLEKIKQLLTDIKKLDAKISLSNVIEADKDTALIFSCESMLKADDRKNIAERLTEELGYKCVVLSNGIKLKEAIKKEKIYLQC